MSYIYIDSDSALQQAAQKWMTVSRIALDSEFMRVDTFFPKLALIQINDGDQTYLIDPLKITEWQPLRDVFTLPTVLKVLHSCSEDLDAFYQNIGVLPQPIFDTQMAAAMASVGGIMGYQKLVKALLDVELEKGETRSNWLKRPLSDKQLHYAADDVIYLLPVTDEIEKRLKKLNRQEWVKEDCARLLEDWLASQQEGYSYTRVKQSWMLKHHQLNVLSALVSWREARCRTINIPRAHLISDSLLLDISKYLPQNFKQLSAIKGIKGPTLRKEGEQILEIIQACKDVPKDEWPERMDRPLSQVAGEWFKDMRKLVGKFAEELEVPPEHLARKKQLEWMLRQGYPNGPFALPESMQGWRKSVIAEPLIDLLNDLAER